MVKSWYLSNQGSGYASLWLLVEAPPAAEDTTTSVKFPKGGTGYMKVVPGTQNTTIASSLPTAFDGRGWRIQSPLRAVVPSGAWRIYVTIVTGKYVTGNISIHARLWRSPNPDGSGATAVTDWLTVAMITSPSANTRYNVWTEFQLGELRLDNEYIFAEFALGTTSACVAAAGCVVTFVCNGGEPQRIDSPTPVPLLVERVVARSFPMMYLLEGAKVSELISRVGNAAIEVIARDFPLHLIKKGTANELRSKWTQP